MSSMITLAESWMTTPLAVLVADIGTNVAQLKKTGSGACCFNEIQFWEISTELSCMQFKFV